MNTNFEEKPIKINDYGLFDLGVTDINNDGYLDIFTSNHSGRQSLLVNHGGLAFEDTFSAMKMAQDPSFPGLVVTEEVPAFDHTGLYVYWSGPDIAVRSHGFGPNDAVSGRIDLLSPVKITEKKKLSVIVKAEKLPSGATHSSLEFSGKGDGYFDFQPYIHALPIRFRLTNISSSNVYVGNNRISPKTDDFTFQMRDRHGRAWTDLNDDNKMDVFITRGGLRGLMKSVPLEFWDELFLSTPTGMEEVGRQRGLAKKGCAGRQAAWVDANADKRLDIYVVCAREIGEKRFPNQLFQQTPNGDFVDTAAQVGLDLPTDGTFLWVDADLDGDLDLFWSDSNGGFSLLRNDAGKFSASAIKTDFPHGHSYHLSMADFDNDGDIDIFSAGSNGNVLFVNDKGTYTAVAPKTLGLPQKSKTADWVDYDNDGLVDLYAVPGGLYKQTRNGHFKSTSILRFTPEKWSLDNLTGSRATWFDADNNGTRDLLVSNQYFMNKSRWAKLYAKLTSGKKRFGKLGFIWRTHFFVNHNNENHWLEVKLVGPPGNRQAIGGRVTVMTSDGEQLQQVGGAEGSHYSQGHYRLYFGLGSHSKVRKINVIWPDGQMTEMHDLAGDRLLTVRWKVNK